MVEQMGTKEWKKKARKIHRQFMKTEFFNQVVEHEEYPEDERIVFILEDGTYVVIWSDGNVRVPQD